MHDAQGHLITASRALPASLIGAMGWFPLTLALFWLAYRVPIEPGRIRRALLVHSAAVAGVVFARAIFIYGLDPLLHWYDAPPTFGEVLLQSVWNNLFQTWLFIGAGHALLFWDRAREREQHALRLQSQLADARLAALSSQLNPHFLFNALNSIAELVHRDAEAADRMIVGLAALLRRSLETRDSIEVPLQEELRLIGHYLDIEAIRLGPRLQVEWGIAPETLTAMVPPLILQPIVENAIRHGVSRRLAPGRVAISARHERDRLLLEVSDDGTLGADQDREPGHGIGLSTTRGRLECLYGNDHELTVEIDAKVGATVRLRLPLRRAREAA